MKNHIIALLTALVLTACSSPMTMPNGLPLPDEQSSAIAALKAQPGVTITSTGPDHIAWKTAPQKGKDAGGRPYIEESSTIAGFRNGKATRGGTSNTRMEYTDLQEQEALAWKKFTEQARAMSTQP